eukprot:1512730-Alexandrium_andersonii.AAC.1
MPDRCATSRALQGATSTSSSQASSTAFFYQSSDPCARGPVVPACCAFSRGDPESPTGPLQRRAVP